MVAGVPVLLRPARDNGRRYRQAEAASRVKRQMRSVTAILAPPRDKMRNYACIIILFLINLLNYMDRYTVAGVLTQIQAFFLIDDAQAGLIQTVFIVFYMFFAPACGFLGDRYNRKWIMISGISVWLLAVLASSFALAEHFWLFLLLRGVVGIGEASYATIAPTIIADVFALADRGRALMFFYFAIPVGSGLGYITGSSLASALGGWQWGIRLTPLLGAIAVLLAALVMIEPQRGEAEREAGALAATDIQATSYWDDIKAICRIPTYLSATVAYTSVVFVTGTLSWWAPAAIDHAYAMMDHLNSTADLPSDKKNEITFNFGLVTVIGGIVGVSAGTIIAQIWQNGKLCCKPFRTERANPLVCAVGSVVGVPALFLGLHLIVPNMKAAWAFFFITITALCLNWAVNVDMLLDIVVPPRRGTANSWQILISHLFGDASGPYVVGLVSDTLRGSSNTPEANFYSLLRAFYIPNVILVISAALFFIAAAFFVHDKRVCRAQMGYETSKSSSASYSGKQVKISCVSGVPSEAFS